MIKSGLALATAAFLVSPYGPFPLTGNDDPTGRWRATVERSDCRDRSVDDLCLQLRLERGARLNRSSWSFSVPASELSGLDVREGGVESEAVHFELARPAGTFVFEGRFDRRGGRGDFEFVRNEAFTAAAVEAGFAKPSLTDQMVLAIHEVDRDALQGFARRGYSKRIDHVVAFAIHGVTTDFIDELADLGYQNPSADQLVALRIHGVTPEFAGEMQRGKRRPGLDQLVAMKIHGVDRELPRRLAAEDLGDFDEDDLVTLKVHDVNLDLARALRKLDVEVDVDGLVALTVQGVDPGYVERMAAAGVGDLDVDDLVSLKVQGIDPEYIRGMMATGLRDLDIDDLIGAKIQGLDGSYVRRMRDAGLRGADLEEMVGLKIQGVDPSFVRRYLEEEPDADAADVTSAWLHRDAGRRRQSH